MVLTNHNDLLDKESLGIFSNTLKYWSNIDNLENQRNTFLSNCSGHGSGDDGGWFYFKTLGDDQVDNNLHT